MIDLAKEISFWLMFGIGICVALGGLFWMLDWALTYTFKSLGLYGEVVEFLRQRAREKRKNKRVSR